MLNDSANIWQVGQETAQSIRAYSWEKMFRALSYVWTMKGQLQVDESNERDRHVDFLENQQSTNLIGPYEVSNVINKDMCYIINLII